MSSGIFFQGYRHDGTNGLIEYVLESCVQDFDRVDVDRARPALREFFRLSHQGFYSGLYVFLDDELVREPKDATFLADLFERVFARLQQPGSELTEMGRVMVATNLMPLVERLRRYAEGILPRVTEA